MSVSLNKTHTISELYRSTTLRAAQAESVRYPPLSTTLDRVSLYQGDITKLEVDAIVNAANSSLLGGGGVDGAIHRAAGLGLLEECKTLNGCATGDAKITGGHKLPAKHVIHTVGPIYYTVPPEQAAKLLGSCYKVSLQVAANNGCETVAFPSISTGAYHYPIRDATEVALRTVRDSLEKEAKLKRVIFVVFGPEDLAVYKELIPLYFPPVETSSVD